MKGKTNLQKERYTPAHHVKRAGKTMPKTIALKRPPSG
jgi:hypothetical protein